MTDYNLEILEPVLQDNTIHEIMIVGHHQVFVAREAFAIEDTDFHFENEAHVLAWLKQFAPELEVSPRKPIADARLSDGTRIHVVMPPIAVNGIAVNIRRVFRSQMPTWETLIDTNAVSADMVQFLKWCVRGYVNILVVGGTGSGKTTLLNMLANETHEKQRLITVEGNDDLLLQHKNVVRLVTQPDDNPTATIGLRDLFKSAMKMRPDRIIASEVNGAEAYDMLQAISAGVEGSMFVIQAQTATDAIQKLEMLCIQANPSSPLLALRHLIAKTIDLVVTIEISGDGWRRVSNICEVAGITSDTVDLREIFHFVPSGQKSDSGKILGEHVATGYVPKFIQKVLATTPFAPLPESIFKP